MYSYQDHYPTHLAIGCCLNFGRVVVSLTHSPFSFTILLLLFSILVLNKSCQVLYVSLAIIPHPLFYTATQKLFGAVQSQTEPKLIKLMTKIIHQTSLTNS